MIKFYGNCIIDDIKWLTNIVLDHEYDPAFGEGNLVSLRSYFSFLMEFDLLKKQQVDLDNFALPDLKLGFIYQIKGELSKKPEGVDFESFRAEIEICNSESIKSKSLINDLNIDYFFRVKKYFWTDEKSFLGLENYRCPLCKANVPYKANELFTTSDTWLTTDREKVRRCESCGALICISSDDKANIQIILLNHLYDFYSDTQGRDFEKGELKEELGKVVFSMVKLVGLTIYDLDKHPTTSHFIFAMRKNE